MRSPKVSGHAEKTVFFLTELSMPFWEKMSALFSNCPPTDDSLFYALQVVWGDRMVHFWIAVLLGTPSTWRGFMAEGHLRGRRFSDQNLIYFMLKKHKFQIWFFLIYFMLKKHKFQIWFCCEAKPFLADLVGGSLDFVKILQLWFLKPHQRSGGFLT